MVQWLRLLLPVQEAGVCSLVRELSSHVHQLESIASCGSEESAQTTVDPICRPWTVGSSPEHELRAGGRAHRMGEKARAKRRPQSFLFIFPEFGSLTAL